MLGRACAFALSRQIIINEFKLRMRLYIYFFSKDQLGACATLASKRLLDCLIQFAESQEVEKYLFNVIMEP